MKSLLILTVLSLYCLLCNCDDERGRLLASKNVLNELLIEGKDVTVEYSIYNVGGSAVTDVELNDESYNTDDVEVIQGNTHVKWPRLAPGSNVSHVVILKPLKAGILNFTSATVSYKPTADAHDKQIGYTSAPGADRVMNYKEYDRKFSPHITDWAVFGLMTLPSLGMPFLLWHNSKSKYETTKPKKN